VGERLHPQSGDEGTAFPFILWHFKQWSCLLIDDKINIPKLRAPIVALVPNVV